MMYLFVLLFLISFILLVIGIVSPKIVVRWGKITRGRVLFFYGSSMILSFVLFVIFAPKVSDKIEGTSESNRFRGYDKPKVISTQPQKQDLKKEEIKQSKTKEQVPLITEDEKKLALDVILGYNGVRDAAIIQKGAHINISIIVDYSTSKNRARDLCDNFVRAVKGFSKDDHPGKEIGRGIYYYHVGAFYPDEKIVIQGVKNTLSSKISWL